MNSKNALIVELVLRKGSSSSMAQQYQLNKAIEQREITQKKKEALGNCLSKLKALEEKHEWESRIVKCYRGLIVSAVLAPTDWYSQHGMPPPSTVTQQQKQMHTQWDGNLTPLLNMKLEEQKETPKVQDEAVHEVTNGLLINHVTKCIRLAKCADARMVAKIKRQVVPKADTPTNANSSYRNDRLDHVIEFPFVRVACPDAVDMTFLAKLGKAHYSRLRDLSRRQDKKRPSFGGMSNEEYSRANIQFQKGRKWLKEQVESGFSPQELNSREIEAHLGDNTHALAMLAIWAPFAGAEPEDLLNLQSKGHFIFQRYSANEMIVYAKREHAPVGGVYLKKMKKNEDGDGWAVKIRGDDGPDTDTDLVLFGVTITEMRAFAFDAPEVGSKGAKAATDAKYAFFGYEFDPNDCHVAWYFKFTLVEIQSFVDKSKHRAIGIFHRFPVYKIHKRVVKCPGNCHMHLYDGDHCVVLRNKWNQDYDIKEEPEETSKRSLWESWGTKMIEEKLVFPLLPLVYQTETRKWWKDQKGLRLTVTMRMAYLDIAYASLDAGIFEHLKNYKFPWDVRLEKKQKEKKKEEKKKEEKKEEEKKEEEKKEEKKRGIYVESKAELKLLIGYLKDSLRQPKGLGGDITMQTSLRVVGCLSHDDVMDILTESCQTQNQANFHVLRRSYNGAEFAGDIQNFLIQDKLGIPNTDFDTIMRRCGLTPTDFRILSEVEQNHTNTAKADDRIKKKEQRKAQPDRDRRETGEKEGEKEREREKERKREGSQTNPTNKKGQSEDSGEEEVEEEYDVDSEDETYYPINKRQKKSNSKSKSSSKKVNKRACAANKKIVSNKHKKAKKTKASSAKQNDSSSASKIHNFFSRS